MSLPKRTLILAGALCVLGVVLRIVGVEWGLDVLVLSILVAVLASALMQRSVQHELATLRRNSTNRLQALAIEQEELRATLAEHGKLQRTTLYYAKNSATSAGSAVPPVNAPGGTPAPTRGGQGIAGRSSTPEVTNSRAQHTFAGFLEEPSEGIVVSGVLTPEAIDALPDGVGFRPFLPFRAAESLAVGPSAMLIVIDQAAFRAAPWDRAIGPVGIGMMRDLELALHQSLDQDMQILVLEDRIIPDIHTSALDAIRALHLPLSKDDSSVSAGAPPSSIVSALSAFAEHRRLS